MLKRRLLTKEFVAKAKLPEAGEIWISDTKLRGFGLRLWATAKGGGKAYGLRVRDQTGKTVRRTYNPERFAHWLTGTEGQLPNHLGQARAWARIELFKLRNPDDLVLRSQLHAEEQQQRQRSTNQLSKISLGEAAQNTLCWLRINGRADSYVDRLDMILTTLLPPNFQKRPLLTITAEEMADQLVQPTASMANMRLLKAFIGQIHEAASSHGLPVWDYSSDLSKVFWSHFQERMDVRYPELRDLTADHYQRIFARLDEEKSAWKAATCIRLYFKFGAPLHRVTAGRWAQIYRDVWYPFWPDERTLWFEAKERIDAEAADILSRLRARLSDPDNDLWFPSASAADGHITNTERLWRRCLADTGNKYYPLREYARSFRNPTNPSYLISFLRIYGPSFRHSQNAAEVFKGLMLARGKSIKIRLIKG